jgi:DNA-directed RNA polymerase III subunit RPC3
MAILLRRGRLTTPMLVQHTQLSTKYVQHGLVVLIQQNLAYYYYDEQANMTYYEANPEATYSLVRIGKILELIQTRHGEVCKEVAQLLLQLGHTKVSDVLKRYDDLGYEGLSKKSPNGGLKGQSVSGRRRGAQSALSKLVEAGLIEAVVPNMFRSPNDTYQVVEKEILQNHFGGSTRGLKQKDEVKNMIRQGMRDIRSEGHASTPKKGLKRGHDGGHAASGKRRQLNNGVAATNGMVRDDEEDEYTNLNVSTQIMSD